MRKALLKKNRRKGMKITRIKVKKNDNGVISTHPP